VAIVAAIFTGVTLIFIRKSLWRLNKLIVVIVTSLILIQIIMGIFVITSKLNPIIVAVHLSTAVTIFSLIFVLLRESYLEVKKGRV
jgi:heme A synthase